MKILFADAFPPPQLERLRGEGHECEFAPMLTGEDLPGAVPGFDALVVRSTRVGAAVLEAADCLKLVVRAGAGTNTIDTARARELGIDVSNVPGANALAVAELTLGLIISADRRIPDNVADSAQRGMEQEALFERPADCSDAHSASWGPGRSEWRSRERAAAFGMRILVLASPRRSDAARARLAAIGATEQRFTRGACREQRLPHPARPGRRTDPRGWSIGTSWRECARGRSSSTRLARTSSTRTALIEALDAKDHPRRRSTSTTASRQAARPGSIPRSPGIQTCTEPIISAPPPSRRSSRSRTAWPSVIAAFVDGKVINCVNAARDATQGAA